MPHQLLAVLVTTLFVTGTMFFSLGLSLETTGTMLFGMAIFTETILNHMYVININENNYETELLGEEVIILQNNPEWRDLQKQYLKLLLNDRIASQFGSELYSHVVEETNLKAKQMIEDGDKAQLMGVIFIIAGITTGMIQIMVYINYKMKIFLKERQQE